MRNFRRTISGDFGNQTLGFASGKSVPLGIQIDSLKPVDELSLDVSLFLELMFSIFVQAYLFGTMSLTASIWFHADKERVLGSP